MSPAERAALKRAVNAARRAALTDERFADRLDPGRCLGAGSVTRYKAGCRCVDCRAASATQRREYRRAHAEQEAAYTRLWRRRRKLAASYPIAGAEPQDGEQVALVAMWEAWRRFNPDLGVPFEAFATEVAKRRLLDAQTKASRLKHRVLVEAERDDVLQVLPRLAPDPWEVMIGRWQLGRVIAALPTLTELERCALRVVLNGVPYAGDRVMDNAVQRMRRKLREAIAA